MNDFILRYTQMVQKLINDEKIKKIDFTKNEALNIVQTLGGLVNTVNFYDTEIFKNKKYLSLAINDNIFYHGECYINSEEYTSIVKNNPKLSDIKNLKTIKIEDVTATRFYGLKCYKVYKLNEKPNTLMQFRQIESMQNYRGEILYNTTLDMLLKAYGDAYTKDGNVYIPMNDGTFGLAKQEGKNVNILPYDDAENPFNNKLFRLFDKDGEITDFSKINTVNLIKQLRVAEAHKQVYYYKSGEMYGARAFMLDSTNMVALVSNVWYDNLYQFSNNTWQGDTNDISVLYVPRLPKPIKQESDLDNKLSKIKIINVNFYSPEQKILEQKIIEAILKNYSHMGLTNISVVDYLKENLKPFVKGKLTVTENSNINTDLLKAKLVNNKGFYNMAANDKENEKKQNAWIKYLIEEMYGFDLIKPDIIAQNGKVNTLKIDLKSLYAIWHTELSSVQELAGLDAKATKIRYTTAERYISLCAFCIYHNLIHNGFMDAINDRTSNIKGYVPVKSVDDLQKGLMIIDMSAFKIKTKKEEFSPKFINQRLAVLRAVRNSVAHNNFLVKYSKNGKIEDSNFIFTLENSADTIVINSQKFLEFINNPLFVEFGDGFNQTLTATNVKELEQTMVEWAKKISERPKNKLVEHHF